MIFVLDNYDSFTYNLVHLLYELGAKVEVRRNRETTTDKVLSGVASGRYSGILLSPGPGRPENAGVMPELILALQGRLPIMGVCLGHQAIGQAFGARVVSAKRIMHGKLSYITHDGKGIFAGLRNEFKAMRYHSLALEEATLPESLEISARSEDGEIMGIRHKTLPIESVQYHPESIMTTGGKTLVSNFLKMCR
ncbi:MAG: aminodeoxychorismate/anthranilate synthase component II [Planctomycetia bacterium]|nr:aminodeoxychorismate/anthranilate synthase component II [Planctomycetia bacterium]